VAVSAQEAAMRVRALTLLAVRVSAALGVALLPALAAAPAAAGGPTSVLLSAPALGRTASLYLTDPEYDALAEHVGNFLVFGSTGEQPGDGSSSKPHAFGDAVTLTWLLHDVTVWRVDRVYTDAPGGPWIASQETGGGIGNIWDAPETWHRADEPKALLAMLGSMDLLAGTSAASPGEATTPVTAEQAAPRSGSGTTDRAAIEAATGPADAISPALAGLLGLVVGAGVAGLAAVALLRRSAARLRWAEPDVAGDEMAGQRAGDDVLVAGPAGGALTRR
jgi:hypothetical protein